MSSLRPNSAADNRLKSRLQSATTTTQQFQSGSTSSVFSNYPNRRQPTGNYSNMTSTIMARDNLGNYHQNLGTISQNGLRVLDGLLNNTTHL